ncbi:hypothetical protein [Klebsiella sp. PL-2018]|uniref:hypothetical protein n=1 Tax=Klebsiella sp. PL-2018 TaxID=2851540 RepID=UPI001C22446E|nr:hypothetical protein [Klebsiella sp. PL-2018]QXD01238.1 hypothetical protein MKleb_5737 [Klebsiella sp. PL-2018]
MFRYFRLRVAQVMLILSFTLPFALLFSFHLSAEGGFDAWQFWTLLAGSTAVMWGGLALYTRDIDRKRQLPDAVRTYVSCGNTSVSMKVNEKADIIWQILQSDVLFKKQTRMWWRAVGFMLRKAFVRAPAVLLPAVCLVLWFSPDEVVALVADIQTGAATCLVYAAGNILFIVYIVAGGVFGICEMFKKQEGDLFCFAPEYQAQVREFARAQQSSDETENAQSVSPLEADE